VTESPAFSQLQQEHTAAPQPLIEVLRWHPRAVLLGAGTRGAEAGFVVIFSTFILSYATQTGGAPRPAVLSALVLATVCTVLLVLLSGALSDRFGRRRLYLAGAAIATLAALPACLLIDTKQIGLLTLGMVLGMLGPGIMFGPQASFLAELFPTRVRSSGTSLGFQLGGVVWGGLSPVIAAALVGTSANLLMVGAYMLALGLISLGAVALMHVPAESERAVGVSLTATPGATA
jgi:MFS family permease